MVMKDQSIENVIMPVTDICLDSFKSPTYIFFIILIFRFLLNIGN